MSRRAIPLWIGLIVMTLLAAGASACGGAQPLPSAPDPNPGSPSVLLLDGSEVPWEQIISSEHPTLVVFSTTWCHVCRREQPAVEAWARANAGQGDTVLVVSGSDLTAVRSMVSDRGIDTEAVVVAVDAGGAVADRYQVTATPTLFLVPPDSGRAERFQRILDVPRLPQPLPSERVPVTDSGAELGTSYDVIVLTAAADVERARRDLAEVRDLVRALELRFSEWRPDSEISRINARAAMEAVPVSDDMARLLAGARHVSEMTGGAFDITWRPLGEVWDQAEAEGAAPDQARMADVLSAVGVRHLGLSDGTVRFGHPETQLGIAGVAKGWIVDAAFHRLAELGYEHVVVNIGGDLRTSGRDERGAMRTFSVDDPYEHGQEAARLWVEDTAIATSGNALRVRQIAGESYGHILDPRTGYPPDFDGSVTVLTRDAAMADALATALFVMGPDEGMAFVEGLDGVEAVYVTRDGLRGTLREGIRSVGR